jgi:hypothetical protein
MSFEFARLGNFLAPGMTEELPNSITYISNPVVVSIDTHICRLFFNSRDKNNRSEVYSVDFDVRNFSLIKGSFKMQLAVSEATPDYCRDGISLGSYFNIDSKSFIGFMGWKVPKDLHWVGEVGLLEIDKKWNVSGISKSPWIPVSDSDPISLSYPAVSHVLGESFVWYGTTKSWDFGNGEMLHIIEKSLIQSDGSTSKTGDKIEFEIGSAQAFSRPTYINFKGRNLIGYSVRGNRDKYRIGIREVIESGCSSKFGRVEYFTSGIEDWENQMVEYPYFFKHEDSLYMFYNGNSFGKTGVGVCKVFID